MSDLHVDFTMFHLHVYVLLGSSQIRLAHTDVSFPDFTAYRRDSVKDPSADSEASAPARKAFTYIITAGMYRLLCMSVPCSLQCVPLVLTYILLLLLWSFLQPVSVSVPLFNVHHSAGKLRNSWSSWSLLSATDNFVTKMSQLVLVTMCVSFWDIAGTVENC